MAKHKHSWHLVKRFRGVATTKENIVSSYDLRWTNYYKFVCDCGKVKIVEEE